LKLLDSLLQEKLTTMEECNYCILCQDQHTTTDQCMKCKSCGKNGHVRKDCPRGVKRKQQSQERNSNQVRKAAKFSPVNEDDFGIIDRSFSSGNSINDDDNANVSIQEENLDIIDISDDQVETLMSSNNVSTYDDIDATEETVEMNKKNRSSGVKPKIDSKKIDHGLEPGKYNIVVVHIELFRSRKQSSTSLTQIGCAVPGSDDSFFRSIKPSGLEKYLDCYKLGGDLLQALHMTREDDGTFLFRKQFENVGKCNKIVCVEESEAISSLIIYLKRYPNCVILSVDEDTVAILTKKLGMDEVEKLKVVGFTYWKRVLKYLDVEDYKNVDLEDYCGDELPSYKSALDIAKILMKSVDAVSSQRKHGRKSFQCDFFKLCKRIDSLSKPKRLMREKGDGNEHIEVYSSFRPTMAATISAHKLEQIVISSESDSEPEETGESQTWLWQTIEYYEEDSKRAMLVETGEESRVNRVRASTRKQTERSKAGLSNASEVIEKNVAEYWKLEMSAAGKPGVICPGCQTCTGSGTLVRLTKISDHVARVHPKILGKSLLCPECNTAVLPCQLSSHKYNSCKYSGISVQSVGSKSTTTTLQKASKPPSNSAQSKSNLKSSPATAVISPSCAISSPPGEVSTNLMPSFRAPPQFVLPGMIVTQAYPPSVTRVLYNH